MGATTARKLYAAGCRAFEDVERYYGVDTGVGEGREGDGEDGEDGYGEGEDEDGEGEDADEKGKGGAEELEEIIADAYIPDGWSQDGEDGNGKSRSKRKVRSGKDARSSKSKGSRISKGTKSSATTKKPTTTTKPKIPSITPRVALELREDLAQRIPRTEVEAIQAAVVEVLDDVRPGCVTVVVGG